MTVAADAPIVISTVGAEWRNLTPPWSREHGGRRSLDSEYHQSGFHLPPYRHVPSLEMTVASGTPLVISTVAGQPPIGKPLIVQARGPTSADLETLCRVSTEWRNLTPPWSREHGGRRSLDSEYHRSGFHLPPIPARSFARDDGGGGRLSRHFDSGSGVETSYASNSRNDALHPSRHFDESAAEWRNLLPPMRQVTCHHFEGKGSIS